MEAELYPNWLDAVKYSADGPQHKLLIGTDGYRAVLVGLEAGQRIPPHPSSAAAYHFLDGSGWMDVDGDRLPVHAGSTVVVPAGASRGVEAQTRLAFFGSHGTPPDQKPAGRPVWMFGAMAFFALLTMVGLMALGMSPMARMIASMGDLGLGVWGTMILPVVGSLGMVVLMAFMFRRMTAGTVMMVGHEHHHQAMGRTTAEHQAPRAPTTQSSTPMLLYTIPAISCGHCRETIERALKQVPGVESVQVDVDAKQAAIRYGPPAAPAQIEAALIEIGYPPETR